MKIKTMSVVVFSLVLVAFVAHAREMKQVEFGNDFKFENPVKTDRGIASEKEREPSSVVAQEKKKQYEEKEESVEPKPWLYKTDPNKKY